MLNCKKTNINITVLLDWGKFAHTTLILHVSFAHLRLCAVDSILILETRDSFTHYLALDQYDKEIISTD